MHEDLDAIICDAYSDAFEDVISDKTPLHENCLQYLLFYLSKIERLAFVKNDPDYILGIYDKLMLVAAGCGPSLKDDFYCRFKALLNELTAGCYCQDRCLESAKRWVLLLKRKEEEVWHIQQELVLLLRNSRKVYVYTKNLR